MRRIHVSLACAFLVLGVHCSDTQSLHDASAVPDDAQGTLIDARIPNAGDAMPTNPGDLGDQIGVVGCSNTRDAVEGYLAASTMDRLINTAQGGNAMSQWAETSGGPWVQYQAMRPVNGYSAVWLNLCQRAVAGLDQSLVDTVIANIRTRDAGATIIISPLNSYDAESCGVTNGNEIPDAGTVIADDTAALDAQVVRGPSLGPLGDGELADDNCHPNAAGEILLGQQMVQYFDQ